MDLPRITFGPDTTEAGFLAAAPAPPLRVPPGGRGLTNGGVIAILQPGCTEAQRRDMAAWLIRGTP